MACTKEDVIDDEEIEEWRQIPSHPTYSVSNMGRVRNDGPRKGRWQHTGPILGGSVMKTGYRAFILGEGKDRKGRTGHTLVAEAFLGPRPDGMLVLHGNGIRTDNRLSNLRYGTPKDNTADAIRHGTFHRGSRTGSSKLTDDDVHEMRRLMAERQLTNVEIAARFGVTYSSVTTIKSGRSWAWLDTPGVEVPEMGERVGVATAQDLRDVREALDQGELGCRIAERLGVNPNLVSSIKTGKKVVPVD